MPLKDVVGHRHLIEMLARAVARDTLPPSLIFTGPDGVGKATVAVALAQRLNCESLAPLPSSDDATADACGVCSTCQRIARGADAFRGGTGRPALDCLLWLSPDDKGTIRIDAVRDVLKRAGFRPFDGRERVIVIDAAHTLGIDSQQALLKMLEEPPSATRFLLITDQADALLPTIRSRCPRLRFGPLSPADIAPALVERFGWDRADAEAAAVRADGQLGRAFGGSERDARQARAIAAAVLEQVASSRRPFDKLDAAQALLARSERASDTGRSKSAAVTRQDILERLDSVAALLRDIGVVASRAGRARIANLDLTAWLDQMARTFSGDRLVRAFDLVSQARTALERNASQKVVADWLALHL